jgi:chromosome segregation ATPase|tara:strand:+ start:4561 stop:4908 length:348 start_codon:yes stop_codon:yes gene_type:complete
MIKIFLIILTMCSISFSQYTLTKEDVETLYNSINELEYQDSLNVEIINNLNVQITMYKELVESDSSIIADQKEQIELLEEQIKMIKPKWYDNKYLYWLYGAGTIVISSWVTANVK